MTNLLDERIGQYQGIGWTIGFRVVHAHCTGRRLSVLLKNGASIEATNASGSRGPHAFYQLRFSTIIGRIR
jgi:hypothetical protein